MTSVINENTFKQVSLQVTDDGRLKTTGSGGGEGGEGTPGADGKTVRNGAGAPSNALGVNGDFYIDTTAHAIYGPKTGGAWGSPTSLIGPPGADGEDGEDGAGGVGGGANVWFRAHRSYPGQSGLATNANVTVIHDVLDGESSDSPYDPVTGVFTAPSDGQYVFAYQGHESADGYITPCLFVNGEHQLYGSTNSGGRGVMTALFDLQEGDTVQAGAYLATGNYGPLNSLVGKDCWWMGWKLGGGGSGGASLPEGDDGQFLSLVGGEPTWVDAPSGGGSGETVRSAFRAHIAPGSITTAANDHTALVPGVEEYDLNDEYDPTTGIWTCKVAGPYQFGGQVLTDQASGNIRMIACIFRNGSNTSYGEDDYGGNIRSEVSTQLLCEVGDEVQLCVFNTDTHITGAATADSYFYGAAVGVVGASAPADGGGDGEPSDFKLLATAKLSADAAYIDFTDIAQTYKHLKVVASVRGTSSGLGYDDLYCYINGDSTLGHYTGNAQYTGSSTSNSILGNTPFFADLCPGSAPDGMFTEVEGLLTAYTSSKMKQWQSVSSGGRSVSQFYHHRIFNVMTGGDNTDPITSLRFAPSSGDPLAAGTEISIYGVEYVGEPEVGMLRMATSSPVPSGHARSFAIPSAASLFIEDTFAGSGSINGRALEAGGYTWVDGSTGSTVSSGNMNYLGTASDFGPAFDWTAEQSYPGGLFIESKFTAPTDGSCFIMYMNLGMSSIGFYSMDDSLDGQKRIRMEVTGLNGRDDGSGNMLPPSAEPGQGVSASYSKNDFFSAPCDPRGKVLRIELREDNMKMILDGETVLNLTPNFPVKFVATNGDGVWGTDYSGLGLLKSDSDDAVTVDYIRAGSL